MKTAEQLMYLDEVCVRAQRHSSFFLRVVETVGAHQRQRVIVQVTAIRMKLDGSLEVEKRLGEFSLLSQDAAAQIPCRVIERIGPQRIFQRRLRMAYFRQPARLIRKPRIERNGLLNSFRGRCQYSKAKPRFRIVGRDLNRARENLLRVLLVDRRESAHRTGPVGLDL